METGDKRRLLRGNTETLAVFLMVGFITLFISNSPFLYGFFIGGLFCGVNFYLLIIVVSLFLYPGSKKSSAYAMVLLKSLVLFGGLAMVMKMTKFNPAGFLVGFGIYTMILIIRGFITLRRVSNA